MHRWLTDLDDPEASCDEGLVGQAGVSCGRQTSDVVVAVCGSEVERHRAGEVARHRCACPPEGLGAVVEVLWVGGVDVRGDRALSAHVQERLVECVLP